MLLSYYAGTYEYSVVSTISNFPTNNYVQTFGTYFDLLFIPFTNQVYMSSRCSPQYWFNGTTCVAFTCNDPHCASCTNVPNFCTTCAASYNVSSDGSCYNPANITNSTNDTNQTSINTTNSTNSSINSNNTVNSTVYSNSTNSSANNNSNNSTSNNALPFLPFNPFSNNASFSMFLSLLQSTLVKHIY